MIEDLPSDQEYLERLMRNTASPHLSEMKDHFIKQANDAVDEQIKNGIIDVSERQRYLDIQLEGLDPSKVFQNDVLRRLRSSVLSLLVGTDGARMETVPVGILSVYEMNAFAIRTPRGGEAVALNAGLWSYLKVGVYCVLAMMFRKTKDGFGKHHPDETYALNLFRLVELMKAGGGLITMVRNGDCSIADCVGPSARPEPFVVNTMKRAFTFILLHEFGHISHGHLNVDLTRRAKIGFGEKVDIYLTSHNQEYEADEFATQCIITKYKEDEVGSAAFWLSISILFFSF